MRFRVKEDNSHGFDDKVHKAGGGGQHTGELHGAMGGRQSI
jgi:hypothetical protein